MQLASTMMEPLMGSSLDSTSSRSRRPYVFPNCGHPLFVGQVLTRHRTSRREKWMMAGKQDLYQQTESLNVQPSREVFEHG